MKRAFNVLALSSLLLSQPVVVSVSKAADTDGDGRLDLIDVDGFNPNATGNAFFEERGIQDLDGAKLLAQLRFLSLTDNEIDGIDNGDFEGLTELESLSLARNEIGSVDRGDLVTLGNLQSLVLSQNRIGRVADGAFEDVSQLTFLGLSSNQIAHIENRTFQGLARLEDLHLASNSISSLEPGVFRELSNLRTLWLASNEINHLQQGAFDGLENLQSLWLGSNTITSIESGTFAGLRRLDTLLLNDNQLTELNLSGATFENLRRCGRPADIQGFCANRNPIMTLVLDGATLSGDSFNAILRELEILGEASLVDLMFSDTDPVDMTPILDAPSLRHLIVDQSLFEAYADDFNAFESIGRNTVTVVPGACDINRDGKCDLADVDAMTQLVRNGDLAQSELTALIERSSPNGFNTYLGDANLDGEFNSRDLVQVLQAGEYEDITQGNSTWATGDWNGDGDFASSDLFAAFAHGGYQQGRRQATAAVPEPTSPSLVLLAIVFRGMARTRRAHDARRTAC